MKKFNRALKPLGKWSMRFVVVAIGLAFSLLFFTDASVANTELTLEKPSSSSQFSQTRSNKNAKKSAVASTLTQVSTAQKKYAKKPVSSRSAGQSQATHHSRAAKFVSKKNLVRSASVRPSKPLAFKASNNKQQNTTSIPQNLPLKTVMPITAPVVVLTSSSIANSPSDLARSKDSFATNPVANSITGMVPTPKRLNVDFRVGVSGVELASEFDNMQSAGMRFGIDGKYALLPRTLDMHLSATAFFFAGHVQSRLADLQNNSFLWLNEGIVTWHPVSVLGFDAGAIDQSSFDMPLVVGYRAFPGVRETLKTEGRWGFVQLQAEQAIPTSPSLRSKATERESIPQFNTENLSIKIDGLGPVVAKGKVFHYGFRNLPASIAYQGGIYGNTVNGSSEELSSFEYEFDGFGVGGGLSYDVYRGYKISVGAQGYQNSRAPEGQKEARAFILGAELPFGKDLIVKPRWEQYFAEADVAPAYYGEMMYGRANREGNVYRLDFAFPESDFKVSTYYSEASPLIETPTQSQQKYLGFLFEATLKGF